MACGEEKLCGRVQCVQRNRSVVGNTTRILYHFFGAAHTLERYESAFYPPLVSDWRNFETWEEAGGPTTMEYANRVWKQLLRDYEQPPMDPAIDEELRDYVARAKLEIVA